MSLPPTMTGERGVRSLPEGPWPRRRRHYCWVNVKGIVFDVLLVLLVLVLLIITFLSLNDCDNDKNGEVDVA